MGRNRTQIPATAYGVLGMLTFGEMSGYDLAKAIEGSIGFFWAPAKSQLYSELRRLVDLGYATEREVAQTDRPDKRIYTITPAGEEALRRWLLEDPVQLEPIKSTFLLKLFFGHLVGPERMAAQVREYRRDLELLRDRFAGIEREIREHEGWLPPYLTLQFGMAFVKAELAWCDLALEQLEMGETKVRKGGER